MDPNTLIAVGSLVCTGVVAVLTYRSSRAATSASQDANNVRWVEQARGDVTRAQERAAAAEAKADACAARLRRLEVRMVELESQGRYIEARARYIVKMIHDPYMSIDMLRERVPADFVTGAGEESADG